jgi:hypothetical protein
VEQSLSTVNSREMPRRAVQAGFDQVHINLADRAWHIMFRQTVQGRAEVVMAEAAEEIA